MRKTYKPLAKAAVALTMSVFALTAHAQNDNIEYGIFDHLAAGVSLGVDGIGIDVAAPVTEWAAVRAGISFIPNLKIKKNVSIDESNPDLAKNFDLEVTTKIFDFKILADIYPFKGSSFHITAGAFIGKEQIATATNTTDIVTNHDKWGKLGLKLGDYRVTTDRNNGQVDIDVKASAFKPYLGIGIGRAVPKKGRVAVSADLGVKFWGTPHLGATVKDDWDRTYYHQFKYDELKPNDYKDVKDVIETIEKIKVYPVLNVRIAGRLF